MRDFCRLTLPSSFFMAILDLPEVCHLRSRKPAHHSQDSPHSRVRSSCHLISSRTEIFERAAATLGVYDLVDANVSAATLTQLQSDPRFWRDMQEAHGADRA